MIDWISSHSSILKFFLSIATLAVWAFYGQILYLNYRRRTRPRVLINKGVGHLDLSSPCLICNMGNEPIYMLCLIAELETSVGTFSVGTTNYRVQSSKKETEESIKTGTRQGPIKNGRCLEVTNFRELIERAAAKGDIAVENGVPQDKRITVKSLRLTVIAIYASEDKPFGIQRTFELDCSQRQHPHLTPMKNDSRVLTSRKDRQQVTEWLRQYS